MSFICKLFYGNRNGYGTDKDIALYVTVLSVVAKCIFLDGFRGGVIGS